MKKLSPTMTMTVLAAALLAASCTTLAPAPQEVGGAHTLPAFDTATLYRLGRSLHGEQKFDDALRVYDEVLAREPGHVDALNAVGTIRSLRADAEGAEQAFRAAIAAAPDLARSYNNLGYHLIRNGRASEALTVLQQAKALAPRDEQVDVNIALARHRIGGAPIAAAKAAPAPAAVPEPAATVALHQVSEGVYELGGSKLVPAAPAAAVAPAVAVVPAPVAPAPAARVEVSNGNGTTGLARRVGALLGERPRLTNARPFGTRVSSIQYTPGFEQAARGIGARLPVAVPLAPVARLEGANVRVLLGKDFPRNPAAVAVASASQP